MLIQQLTGGLGNQMFQYAGAKAQALRLGVELKLDKTHFLTTPLGKKNLRHYELHHFVLSEGFAQPKFHWIKKYLNTKKVYSGFETFKEQHVHLHPDFFEIRDNTYIEGVFQSEKYFKEYENEVRKGFEFKNPPSSKNQGVLEKINSVNAVSLHVRRGDYISNLETQKTHGVCDLSYYQRAINYLTEKIKEPYFFLFSDEPEWVKQNLQLEFPYEVIDWNKGNNSFEDMRLMSHCQNNIIANSSFSWWGAWLNQNPNKIVIAPERWFADPQHDASDIIPDGWIKL
jgi:hypothetical protein